LPRILTKEEASAVFVQTKEDEEKGGGREAKWRRTV